MNFDQIVGKAKEIYDVAAKKTGDVVEVSKLKIDTMKINGQIKELYEKLGQATYSAIKDNTDNSEIVQTVCEQIDSLNEKLTDLYSEIADRQNVIICADCGLKNPMDNTFCGKCGSKMQQEFKDYSYSQNVAEEQEEPVQADVVEEPIEAEFVETETVEENPEF